MFKEFSFAFSFTFVIYLLCNTYYVPKKAVTNDSPINLSSVEFPVPQSCAMVVKEEKDIFKSEINALISKNRIKKYSIQRRKSLLPYPSKTSCVSPNVIAQELSSLVMIPKLKKIKKEIVIAVIDTGIDLTNPYLSKRIYLPPFLTDINNLDFSKDKSIQDRHGHGSHIAGIILSVFPNAKILPLRYYSSRASGEANMEASIKAMRYAINQGVDIINYSGGGEGYSSEEFKVIKEAEAAGILVVAAAGNEKSNIDPEGKPYYPASYAATNIVSVGNINMQGARSVSSNYGKKRVDLFAPGENITSYSIDEEDNCLMKMTGTSMSTPLVSATLGLLKAYHPQLSFLEIKKLLLNNVSIQENLLNLSKTGGALNVEKSLASNTKN